MCWPVLCYSPLPSVNVRGVLLALVLILYRTLQLFLQP